MTATITIRPATDGDQPAVLQLLQTAMGGGPTGERTAAFLDWKHRANPFGASTALIAEAADGQLAGYRTFMRWRFRAGDALVPAVRAVDTATHPDFQGQGIFTRLTTAALDHAAEHADLVFNTPNDRSRPGYLKMGWQVVGTVPIRIRPVRPLRLARHHRRAGELTTDPVPPPDRLQPARTLLGDGRLGDGRLGDGLLGGGRLDDDAALAELLGRARPSDGRLATDTSPAFLRWRYADVPGIAYHGLRLRDGDGLRGLALGRQRRRGPLVELTLAEVITDPDDHDAARLLLRAAARSGADHVAAHLAPGTAAAAVARSAGYLPVRGQGPTLTVRPLAERLPADPRSLDGWALSLGDVELF